MAGIKFFVFILKCVSLTFFIGFSTSAKISSLLLAKDPPDSTIRAMSDVIREFYIKNLIEFNFIVYGESSNHINDVISGVTREINQDDPVEISHIINFDQWNHEMSKSAVIFVKSQENFQKLQLWSSTIMRKNLTS